jgi:hypothetical protein
MVKLPTLSDEVVQTSSETTSEVHVRSAVEDVKWLHYLTPTQMSHTDEARCCVVMIWVTTLCLNSKW